MPTIDPDRVSEAHRRGLRDVFVTLDRMSEYVTGMDAWQVEAMLQVTEEALDVVETILDDEREAEIDAEADQLVAAMIQAVEEVDDGE